MIRLHHRLEAVAGESSLVEGEAGVVDQHVEPLGALQQFVGGRRTEANEARSSSSSSTAIDPLSFWI